MERKGEALKTEMKLKFYIFVPKEKNVSYLKVTKIMSYLENVPHSVPVTIRHANKSWI